ncbi:MAG: GNAT family N-acetyltransferase [Opitutales bacterium]|nr:GNAT family N-acetyltransferase [Opitutales bacterium]
MIASIWSADELIEFARAISVRLFRILIEDVTVDENHRGNGLGEMIMKNPTEQLKDVRRCF